MLPLRLLVLSVVVVLFSIAPLRADDALPVVSARLGLPRLAAKLAGGQPVTIVFLGGSITRNGGESNGFVFAWPQRLAGRYPGAQIRTVNAGRAATGSDFGAQRVGRDVLAERPDLVVVEFAVNDIGAKDPAATMERVVRRIRTEAPECDILHLHFPARGDIAGLQAGEWPAPVAAHERVAAHYGLPSVALNLAVARAIRSGELAWADYSADDCHPTPAGYAFLSRTLDAVLPALLPWPKGEAPTLPPPLDPEAVRTPEPVLAAPLVVPARRPGVAEVFPLPVFGVQWVGQPVFPASPAAPVWGLFTTHQGNPSALDDATIAIVSPGWWRPAGWFKEARAFTGESSDPILRADPADPTGAGALFGSSILGESPVLTFTAPSAGSYRMVTHAEGIAGFDAPEKGVAVHLGRFPAATPERGVPLACQVSLRRDAAPFTLETEAKLDAGDVVAWVFVKKDLSAASFTGFKVTVERLEDGK